MHENFQVQGICSMQELYPFKIVIFPLNYVFRKMMPKIVASLCMWTNTPTIKEREKEMKHGNLLRRNNAWMIMNCIKNTAILVLYYDRNEFSIFLHLSNGIIAYGTYAF